MKGGTEVAQPDPAESAPAALHEAILHGQADIVNMLLENGRRSRIAWTRRVLLDACLKGEKDKMQCRWTSACPVSAARSLHQIKKNRLEKKVSFLTRYDDEDYPVESMEVGASGYSASAQLVVRVPDIYLSSPRMLSGEGERFPLQDQVGPPAASLSCAHDTRSSQDARRK